MATYAIGDVQGCYDSLIKLLEHINFSDKKDTLWFAGDLVNRGPQSLETLRFIRSLGTSARCVLGNHDITLIAMYYGALSPKPSLQAILDAKDSQELIEWLQQQPLLHVDKKRKICMSHAGIYPKWTLKQAQRYAKEVEQLLCQQKNATWFKEIYGNQPLKWSSKYEGLERTRFIINAFTRMRYVTQKNAHLEHSTTTNPKELNNDDLVPWFAYKKREPLSHRIIFGHWASLGFYSNQHVSAIDTGCVWSNQLTAIRLSDKPPKRFSIPCS